MTLSISTILKNTTNSATSFTTNVLVVGGSYAGISALKTLTSQLKNTKVSVTLVEPRSGFLNILGISRSIVNQDFAKTQYIPYENLSSFKFDKAITIDPKVSERLVKKNESSSDFELTFVQGKVSYLGEKEARYILSGTENEATITFDYVIYSAGRDRKWPTTPEALTEPSYMAEMAETRAKIEKSDVVSIIGAGAVGIEMAADIKHEFPNKTVNLIHPHSSFPPENLTPGFKDAVYKSLVNADVKIYTNTRIAEELESHDLKTTNDQIISSDLNLWCNSHRNNTYLLSDKLKNFISPKNNMFANEYLQLANNQEFISNVFVAGDLLEVPIIKSAGFAMKTGSVAATNVARKIQGVTLDKMPDVATRVGNKMTIIAGNSDIITEGRGKLSINDPHYVEEYRDYRLGSVLEKIN